MLGKTVDLRTEKGIKKSSHESRDGPVVINLILFSFAETEKLPVL